MRRFLILMALLFGLGTAVLPAPANAVSVADMHIVCIIPTVCSSGTTTLVTGGGTLNLDLVSMSAGAMSGEAFLGILVPNGTASISVSFGSLETSIVFSSGFLGDTNNLNELGLTDFQFSAIRSASSQVGVTATFFTAYDWNLGAYNSPGGGSAGIATFTVGPLPTGTVIVAWLEDSGGNAIERTPLSESLTVPERGILILLGIAMTAVGVASYYMRKT